MPFFPSINVTPLRSRSNVRKRCLKKLAGKIRRALTREWADSGYRLRQWSTDRRMVYRSGLSSHRRGRRAGNAGKGPADFSVCALGSPGYAPAYAGETFDGLIAWDSFFHLTQDDQRSMFARFARHSHPGSVLMFTSGPEDGIAIGQFEGEPLFHASLAPEEYRQHLAAIGFRVLEMRAEDPDCAGHTVWLAQRTA